MANSRVRGRSGPGTTASAGWPPADQIAALLTYDETLHGRLGTIDTDRVFQLLAAIPARARGQVLQRLGLGSAHKVSRAMATQVVSLWTHGPRTVGEHLLYDLLAPIIDLFDEIAADDWTDFTGDDSEAALRTALARGPLFSALTTIDLYIPKCWHELGTLAAIGAGSSGAAGALALLAANDGPARAAYDALNADHPSMPRVTGRSLSDLTLAARLQDLGHLPANVAVGRTALQNALGAFTHAASRRVAPNGGAPRGPAEPPIPFEEDESAMPDAEDGAASSGNSSDQVTPAREDLLMAIEELDGLWHGARQAAQRALTSLDAETAADLDDLQSVVRHSERANHLANALSRLMGVPVPPSRRAFAETADGIRRDLADAAWLRCLTRVEGPKTLSDALNRVRDLARAALTDAGEAGGQVEGLRALYQLIVFTSERNSGRQPDFDELALAESAARDGLPPDAHGAILAALSDWLRVPDIDTGIVDEVRSSTDEPSDDDPVSGPVEPPEAEEPDGATSGDSTATEPLGSPSPPEIDLSDLDELLSSGTPDRRADAREVSPDERRPEVTDVDMSTEAGPEPDAVQTEHVPPADLDGMASAIESELFKHGRYALAADVNAAAGGTPACVAARRLAALASQLRNPTGAIAAAFAQEATYVKREDLADDRPGQLLAWASAVRIAVLSPSAGAAGLLAELAPCVADHAALTQIGLAFAEASRAGVIVMPEAADVASALAEAEAKATEQAGIARQLLGNAGVRTIKYAPANVVYQSWMSPSGDLGSLLRSAAENDHGRADDVLAEVVRLRGQVERKIDETFAAQRKHNMRIKIVAGARATLRQRYLEVIDEVAAWAESAKKVVTAASTGPRQAWQATPLARLRSQLSEVRDEIPAELELLGSDLDHPGTVKAVRALLDAALQTCDGHPPRGAEVSPAYALHEELLASDLSLNTSDLVPDGGINRDILPALLTVAGRPAANLLAVYEARAKSGDHDLTAILIDAVRAVRPELVSGLEKRREEDVATFAPRIAAEVADITSKIDKNRMASTLDDPTWSILASRAAALNDHRRRDFGRIRAEVADIQRELDHQREKRISETLSRIEARAGNPQQYPQVATAADVLKELARSGQVASAEEFLEQALIGETLPSDTDKEQHFSIFFPAVPKVCADHPDLLSRLRKAFAPDGGEETTSPALEALRTAIGIAPASLSRARAESGSRAIGAWLALRPSQQRVRLSDTLRHILAQAGLYFAKIGDSEKPARRTEGTWLRLQGVRGIGDALTPTLGSAMSPSGDTLRLVLIRSAVSPATVVEWMSEESPDETVLAIWLAGALSVEERRSLADASRGRPRPPLLVLDEAALAYLVCQAESRRSTFAAISLPFTAFSPYRDTPGLTAPEMFYGRTEELAAIKDLSGSSILYGGRQLGKSALLQTAQRQFDNGADRRAILISIFTIGGDADPERVWSVLWPRLAELDIVSGRPPADDPAEAVHDAIIDWANKDSGRALLVLLDEADAFLEADAASNRFTNVDWCRKIMLGTGRRVKFVFAGLHRTARFDSLPNQPLAHFGQPVSVGPLHPQAAHNLLTRPLEAMGFTFQDRIAIPARVLALANNMPALLQLFGAALMAHLTSRSVPPGSPPTTITGSDIDEVFGNTKLQDAFREKYIHTLNLDHRYLVIAYVVAYAAYDQRAGGFLTLDEISTKARDAWPAGFAKCGSDDFRGLVAECVDLRVLAVDRAGYRIRTPNVLRLLGTEEEIFETLATASERLHVQSPADGAAYRRKIAGSYQRMPLTERQIGEVFKARNRVLVISGSPALGIERAPASLEQARHEGHSRLDHLQILSNASRSGLQHAVSLLPHGHALIVADLRKSTVGIVRDMLAAAQEALESCVGSSGGPAEGTGGSKKLTIVLITGPSTAPAWINHEDRVDLALVDEVGLRIWSDEDNLPFQDDHGRRRLLSNTGGWPMLLTRVTQMARAGSPVSGSEDMLTRLTTDLSTAKGASALVRAALLAGDAENAVVSALATVFGHAAELTEKSSEPKDDLVELLTMSSPELPAIVRRAGFNDLGKAVDALVALNCLTADESGQVRTETVLTRAFQHANVERP